MPVSRREFLKRGATLVGASALLPAVFQEALALLSRQRAHAAPIEDGRVLVVVQMAGGNDGLNAVIPVTDGRYYDARPNIAIAQTAALPLDAATGLNPSMGKLKELWDAGILAIVEGVGYPGQNFSHFVSMDIWQRADPSNRRTEGWLGRYLGKVKGTVEAPFLGLAIGRALPTSLVTPTVAVPALESVNGYQFAGDQQAPFLSRPRLRTLAALYEAGAGASAYGPLLQSTLQAATGSVQKLNEVHQAYKPASPYPANGLGAALQTVAEAIAGGAGVKICHVSLGGFDTHANESTDQPRQLGILSAALQAFYSDLKAHQLDSKVLIMTWSEFGRRVKSNGSLGTDHGSAAPLFFLGTPVKGGLYGQRPDLGNLDNGNLRYTVDFRSAYTTALESWLGVPAKELLGGAYEAIPLLR